jgi:hypothetical protein
MHLSGAILLFTYVIPPSWALDAYGTAPAGDPSADVPPFVFAAGVLACCLAFHVLVHIPSGLLGTRLAHHHGAPTAYASALAIAGVLTASALLLALRGEGAGELAHAWADFMARGSLGLAGYVWAARRSRRSTKP